jgi:putative serine protease PepD
VSPSVVLIETNAGLGSGVVYDDNGNIVTNAHVVAGANTFTVTLANGHRHPATLLGSFPPNDLAVVHVEGETPPPARFGHSKALAVGDIVFAIGNPLGLRSSVTETDGLAADSLDEIRTAVLALGPSASWH